MNPIGAELSAIEGNTSLSRVIGIHPSELNRLIAKAPSLYRRFSIIAKKPRQIRQPIGLLRTVQDRLVEYFQSMKPFSSHAHGGVTSRSTLDHARPHVGKYMVGTVDIKDCFPNTHPGIVRNGFMQSGCSTTGAELLTSLVTVDDQLPQGAPTSTLVLNIALRGLDLEMAELGRAKRAQYTRYVDDLAISSNVGISDLQQPVIAILNRMGYQVAPLKVSFKHRGERQVVTGLVVNDKLRPTKAYIGDLKRLLRACVSIDLDVVACLEECQSIKQLRKSITGRIDHVARFDRKLAGRIRRLIYAIPWRPQR